MACGGILGTRRLRLARAARQPGRASCAAAWCIETLTHLGARAEHRCRGVAMAVMFVFGAHAFVWGTTSTQPCASARSHPACRAGCGSVYMIGVTGGIVVGSVLGGLIAGRWGDHRPVLVRLRRVGGVPGADLAPARPRRPRRRGGPVRLGRVPECLLEPPGRLGSRHLPRRSTWPPRLRDAASSAARRLAHQEREHVVPQEPHAQGLQVLRLLDDPAARARHHLHRGAQRVRQVQRRRRARLGDGRAGRQVAARRQDGGRHLRRHLRAARRWVAPRCS